MLRECGREDLINSAAVEGGITRPRRLAAAGVAAAVLACSPPQQEENVNVEDNLPRNMGPGAPLGELRGRGRRGPARGRRARSAGTGRGGAPVRALPRSDSAPPSAALRSGRQGALSRMGTAVSPWGRQGELRVTHKSASLGRLDVPNRPEKTDQLQHKEMVGGARLSMLMPSASEGRLYDPPILPVGDVNADYYELDRINMDPKWLLPLQVSERGANVFDEVRDADGSSLQ